MGNPLFGKLGRYLRWPRADLPSPDMKANGCRGQQVRQSQRQMMAKSAKRIAFGADQPSNFWMPWLRLFPWFFLSCKTNARVHNAMPGQWMTVIHQKNKLLKLFNLFVAISACNAPYASKLLVWPAKHLSWLLIWDQDQFCQKSLSLISFLNYLCFIAFTFFYVFII
jgi:hypothetical protein